MTNYFTRLLAGLHAIFTFKKRQMADQFAHVFLRHPSQRDINSSISKRKEIIVTNGPFAGMLYTPQACGSALTPKIIGTYEMELHDVIQKILTKDYHIIIDIGCAEGYYAIGLALKCANAQVYAYDIDQTARVSATALASKNGVSDRVHIRQTYNRDELKIPPEQRALLICDCEGCETILLDPEKFPEQRSFDILVEIHDGPIVSYIRQLLVKRFRKTHYVQHVKYNKTLRASKLSETGFRSKAWQRIALEEYRYFGVDWLFLTVRSNSDQV